mgnify:FL=1
MDATEILRFALNDRAGEANDLNKLEFSQFASASAQHLHALVNIVGTDNDIRLVAIGKGIHVFDEDFFASQLVEDSRKRACHIRARDAHYIGKHHGKVCITKDFHRLVHFRNDESEDTEVGSFRHTEGMHVDAILTQNLSHFIDSSGLVFEENR